MPPLPDSQHETFAAARAAGGSQKAAYAGAGFADSTSGGCRLEKQQAVKKRILELRQRADRLRRSGLEETIIDLMEMADHAATLNSAAALNEGRLTRLEANRLRDRLDLLASRYVHRNEPLDLPDDEWLKIYAPQKTTDNC